jgi:hypothetical protein
MCRDVSGRGTLFGLIFLATASGLDFVGWPHLTLTYTNRPRSWLLPSRRFGTKPIELATQTTPPPRLASYVIRLRTRRDAVFEM